MVSRVKVIAIGGPQAVKSVSATILSFYGKEYICTNLILMKFTSNTILIDNYFGLLSSLSRENKIKLIAKLSNSIVDDVADKGDVVDRFYGAFKSDKSAEEIIKEIRDSRTFNRELEAF